MKRVYVAGSSAETERVTTYQHALRELGFEITHDWTVPVLKFGSQGEMLSESVRKEHAREDLEGVRSADILWFLVPPSHLTSRGAWIEFGAALMGGKKTVLSGQTSSESIFSTLATLIYSTDDEALAHFRRFAEEFLGKMPDGHVSLSSFLAAETRKGEL